MRTRVILPLVFGLVLLVAWFLPTSLYAQGPSGIKEPVPGDVLSGVVVITGTATHPSFLRYELAFRQVSGFQSDWIVFAQGDQAVIDNTLAVWDTTVGGESNPVFPDGDYQLRLRVVRTDYNYDEYFVSDLSVSNFSPTPTMTPTITATATSAATPLPDLDVSATRQAASGVLPTLTPFPTPSLQATPFSVASGETDSSEIVVAEERTGVFEQIGSVDTGRFSRAFVFGVSSVAVIFGLLAVYLLMRGVGRRIRKEFSSRRSRGS